MRNGKRMPSIPSQNTRYHWNTPKVHINFYSPCVNVSPCLPIPTQILCTFNQLNKDSSRYNTTARLIKKLAYNRTNGTLCDQPARAVRISLQSETSVNWIYANNTIKSQPILQLMTLLSATFCNAIYRIFGKHTLSKESEREITLSLQVGTLHVATDGSMVYNKETQPWKIEPL